MRTLRGQQPQAFEAIRNFIKSDRKMHLLQGYAGTGKTYLLRDVVDFIQMNRLQVVATAPTNKAVKVLKALIRLEGNFSTIHSALGMKEYIDDQGIQHFRSDPKAGYPAEKYDIIIIDEASMLDDTIFEELVELCNRGKKILFVGDPCQIPPVNHEFAKPFIKEIQEEYKIGVSILSEIIRQAQGSPIAEFAYDIRTDIHKPTQILKPQRLQTEFGGIFIHPKAEKQIIQDIILPLYKSDQYQENIDLIKIIGWKNKTVDAFNKVIRGYLFGNNIPKIIVGDKLIADVPVIEDRMIHISTNEEMIVLGVEIAQEEIGENAFIKYYRTKVKVLDRDDTFDQYMLRIVHEDSEGYFNSLCQLQTKLANSFPKGSYQARMAWIDLYDFRQHWNQVKYSYAISAHKSQSSTYNNAYVLAWDIFTNWKVYEKNRIFYTSCTRPSTNLYIEY